MDQLVASCTPQPATCNAGPGLQPRHVPRPESNQGSFSLWDDTQPTELQQLGLLLFNFQFQVKVTRQKSASLMGSLCYTFFPNHHASKCQKE